MAPAPAPAGIQPAASRGFETKYCAGSAGAGFLFKKPAVSRGFFKIFDQKFFLAGGQPGVFHDFSHLFFVSRGISTDLRPDFRYSGELHSGIFSCLNGGFHSDPP